MSVGRFPHESRVVLVIGFGNTLRSDDGVGPRVAMAVASWRRPGLKAIAVPQLTPELAQPLAAAELAIFVHSRLVGEDTSVRILRLSHSAAIGTLGHASDPGSLLSLGDAIYGRSPISWLITVPAADLTLGEDLSATAERGAVEALERIAALIEENLDSGRLARSCLP